MPGLEQRGYRVSWSVWRMCLFVCFLCLPHLGFIELLGYVYMVFIKLEKNWLLFLQTICLLSQAPPKVTDSNYTFVRPLILSGHSGFHPHSRPHQSLLSLCFILNNSSWYVFTFTYLLLKSLICLHQTLHSFISWSSIWFFLYHLFLSDATFCFKSLTVFIF